MKGIDKKDLDMIWQWFSETDLASATLQCDEKGAYKIELSRASNNPVQAAPQALSMVAPAAPQVVAERASAAPPIAEPKATQNAAHKEIKAPIVGTFYRSASPDVPAFVQVGDKVKKGQTLCIVEAMKVMNEFEAEFDMEIVDILVENATLVEYEQVLFRVIPL